MENETKNKNMNFRTTGSTVNNQRVMHSIVRILPAYTKKHLSF